MSDDRRVTRVVQARPTSDGAGVRLRRSLGTPELDVLDPFLLLDEFKSDRGSDYIAGFPDHPHRGFETVTYMLAGAMLHQDHRGNRGELVAGGVQWMTAGRGIVHSEMPQQREGLLWGFQLWVNLPAADKMCPPRYQDIAPDRVPVVEDGGARVRVVTGEHAGARGPVEGIVTRPLYLDVALQPGAGFSLALPPEHTAFAYVFDGEAALGAPPRTVGLHTLAVLGPGERVGAEAGPEGARFLVVAARPLREPVARHGPFVMNTRGELQQAFEDFQAGRF